jgi:NADH-quinone oxidoreductase subunit H
MFFIYILTLIIPVVITVAFYTLAERKIIAAIQRRTGPNVVGFFGVLQPFADALKAILKEQIKPLRAVFYLFLFAPILCFFLSLLALNFICFKFTRSYFDEYLNFLFFFSISSFNVFGIIFAGWTSNSKYTLLGALRAAAQTFSFEMCFITLLLPIFLLNSTFNLIDIVVYQVNYWNCFVFFPVAIYFFIILLAETNRTPFDLPEAEAELVAGYNLEYSAINFALFFLGEYTNMLLNSCIFVIFFLGGWLYPSIFLTFFPINYFLLFFFFNLKVIFVACLFILVRAVLPRYRFDQLMDLCWKKILPVSCTVFL